LGHLGVKVKIIAASRADLRKLIGGTTLTVPAFAQLRGLW
jgi:hypothetical protein